MRWARETTRSDSERPMSLRWEAGEPTELEPGDLSVLQLLLRDRQMDGCGVTLVLARPGWITGWGRTVALHDGALAHGTELPAGRGGRGAQGAAQVGEGAARQRRLAGQGLVGVMLDGQLEQAAGLLNQQVNLGAQRTQGWHGGGTGAPRGMAELGGVGAAYLVQRHVADGRAVDLQDAVTHVDGVLHVRADAVRVHPAGPACGRGSAPVAVSLLAGDTLSGPVGHPLWHGAHRSP